MLKNATFTPWQKKQVARHITLLPLHPPGLPTTANNWWHVTLLWQFYSKGFPQLKVTTLSPYLSGGLLDLEDLWRGGTARGSCGSTLEGTAGCSSWCVAVAGSVSGLTSQLVPAFPPSCVETGGVLSSIPMSGHGARSDVDTVSSRPLDTLRVHTKCLPPAVTLHHKVGHFCCEHDDATTLNLRVGAK